MLQAKGEQLHNYTMFSFDIYQILQWLKDDFLGYLNEWEESGQSCQLSRIACETHAFVVVLTLNLHTSSNLMHAAYASDNCTITVCKLVLCGNVRFYWQAKRAHLVVQLRGLSIYILHFGPGGLPTHYAQM